jgi:hypothetical protein
MSEIDRNDSASAEANTPNYGGEDPARNPAGASKVVILVDASNVAHGKTSVSSQPQLDYLQRVLAHLGSFPVRVVTLADASLRHKIDRQPELEDLFKSGLVEQVPAGTGADEFLWQLWKRSVARGERAYILTNDLFPIKNARDECLTASPRIAFFFLGEDLILEPSIETVIRQGAGSGAESSSRQTVPPSPRTSEVSALVDPGNVGSGPRTRPKRGEVLGEVRAPNLLGSETKEPLSQSADMSELVEAAVRVIANYTDSPKGRVRRVNFATVAHLLHNEYGGDFVTKFGMRRPKELATRMAEDGLLTVSFKEATMYVEPTSRLESIIEHRALPRRSTLVTEVPSSPMPGLTLPTPAATVESGMDEVSAPPMIEVSAGAPSPVVEVASPDLFLKLVQDHQPKHLFHWSSKLNVRGRWRLEGEFFFVSEGTAYRLPGRGYATVWDFLDGRKHGFEGADSKDKIGDLEEGYIAYDLWKELLEFKGFHREKDRPSEGDIYYYARHGGISTLNDLLKGWSSSSEGSGQSQERGTNPRQEPPKDLGLGQPLGDETQRDRPEGVRPQTQEDREQLMRDLLAHLLAHEGDSRKFEATQGSTEFGIASVFPSQSPDAVSDALRSLEKLRMVSRRTQYVAGYSEAKHVYLLTPSGHRAALASKGGTPPALNEVTASRPAQSETNDDYPDDDDYPANDDSDLPDDPGDDPEFSHSWDS